MYNFTAEPSYTAATCCQVRVQTTRPAKKSLAPPTKPNAAEVIGSVMLSSELFATSPERVPEAPALPAPHSTIDVDSGPQLIQAVIVRGEAPEGNPVTPGDRSVSLDAPSSDSAPPGQLLRSGTKAGVRAPLKEYNRERFVPASHGSAQTGAGNTEGVAVNETVCVADSEAETDMVNGSCAATVEFRRAGIMAQMRWALADQRQLPRVFFSQHCHGGDGPYATPPHAGPYDMHQSWHISKRWNGVDVVMSQYAQSSPTRTYQLTLGEGDGVRDGEAPMLNVADGVAVVVPVELCPFTYKNVARAEITLSRIIIVCVKG